MKATVDLAYGIPVPGGEISRLVLQIPKEPVSSDDELVHLAAMSGISKDVLAEIDMADAPLVHAVVSALASEAMRVGRLPRPQLGLVE